MKSALYEGRVRHDRVDDTRHGFAYRVFLTYLDLGELDTAFAKRWFWSTKRRNLAWFKRSDYMAPHDRPLDEVVKDKVEAELGRRPAGAVRMLTHLRTFGYVFNPVTFYYCFDENDELEAVAAEITNTPWRERHTYVLPATDGAVDVSFDKDFHVSPFFDMDHRYRWRFDTPNGSISVHMTNTQNGKPVFHAGLEVERKPITGANLASALLRHPLLTLRVPLAIYWHALLLWWKRAPFFSHPDKRPSLSSENPS